MSRSIRICSYLLLPLIYLLVNVKIAQLGESFPITIVTFLPVLLLLFVEKISVKKLLIALGLGAGLTLFNYIFGPIAGRQQICHLHHAVCLYRDHYRHGVEYSL
ncbi:putative colanic acid biosynthesis protein [Leclercia adecarboxylata]|uniref:Putative colanic acid biosynthesis protein n=1 Tax=Leclercia adecarboxylata TaxID=83655 RepID=A0A4U9I248_9ENTR|nr:putative colanic acid biosynthesis protein [Leclercia adecarboxylata]